MSESDQFRQYAEEALLWVAQSKTEEEKRLLLELVRTWTEAAVMSAVVDSHRTADVSDKIMRPNKYLERIRDSIRSDFAPVSGHGLIR